MSPPSVDTGYDIGPACENFASNHSTTADARFYRIAGHRSCTGTLASNDALQLGGLVPLAHRSIVPY